MKFKIVRLLFLLFLFSISFLTPAVCQAGGLNASEQKLVAKAMGTFEWNGRQYRAKQMYIDQLVDYLCQDDVDLNADSCDAAAAEMYANVERGVTEAYLYEIGAPDQALAETAMPGQALAETAMPGQVTESRMPPAYSEFCRMSLDILRHGSGQEYRTPVFKDGTVWRFLNPLLYRILGGIEAVCILILLVILVVTFGNHGQRKRRRFKKAVRRVTVAAMSYACFLACTLTALWFGVFSEQTVLKRIEKTAWYETVYDGMRKETDKTLALVQIPETISGDSLKYGSLVIAARQQLTAELEGERTVPDLSAVLAPLRSSVIQYYAGRYPDSNVIMDGVDNLLDGLEIRCESLMSWKGMDWWRKMAQGFYHSLPTGLGGALLIWVMGAAELVCLQQYDYRTVKRFGWCLMWGALLVVCLSLILWCLFLMCEVRTEPEYMSEFLRHTTVTAVYSAVLTGGITGCMAVMFFLISKCMKYES